MRRAPARSPYTKPLADSGLVVMVLAISLGTFLRAPILLELPALFLLAYALTTKTYELLPVAALFTFLYVASQFLPDIVWVIPTAGFLLPLLFARLVSIPRAAREQWAFIRPGRLDSASFLLTLVTSVVAAAALILWAFSAAQLGAWAAVLRDYQGVPRWFLYGIGVPVFALLNAATEELIFRGVLLEALRTRFPGWVKATLGLQATAFAAAHYWAGFPNGKLGYLMTFVYALALGYLRVRTRGLLAPFLAHFTADVVIAILLIALVA